MDGGLPGKRSPIREAMRKLDAHSGGSSGGRSPHPVTSNTQVSVRAPKLPDLGLFTAAWKLEGMHRSLDTS